MPKRLGAWALALLVALAAAPSAAATGSFLDPGARWFTLQWRDGPLPARGGYGRLRPLPDGSILFVHDGPGPNLWRLRPDGRAEKLAWAGEAAGLTTEGTGTALILPPDGTAVVRLDLAARSRTVVAGLAGIPGVGRETFQFGAALAVFGDDSIAVSDFSHVWRISRDRAIAPLPFELPVDALAPMSDGSVAVLARNRTLFRMRPDGTHSRLVGHVLGIGTAPDGRLVLLTGDATRKRLAVLDALGHVTTYRSDASAVPGDGDGALLQQTRWPRVRSITVATDGSLVIATGDGRLRALVPRDSHRPRIAIDPRSYASFRTGRVDYLAGVPGAVALEVRANGRTADRAGDRTNGGLGQLRVAPPSHGRYRLRLRLTTATAVTDARWVFDARRTLPIPEALRAVTGRYEAPENDERSYFTHIGSCLARGRTVRCRVMRLSSREEGRHTTDVPAGWARAVLRVDGTILSSYTPPATLPKPPTLKVSAPARPRRLRARVTSSRAGRVTMTAYAFSSGARGLVKFRSIEATLRAGRAWDARLKSSRRQAARLRRWLAQHRTVDAWVTATVVHSTRRGPVTVTRQVETSILG